MSRPGTRLSTVILFPDSINYSTTSRAKARKIRAGPSRPITWHSHQDASDSIRQHQLRNELVEQVFVPRPPAERGCRDTRIEAPAFARSPIRVWMDLLCMNAAAAWSVRASQPQDHRVPPFEKPDQPTQNRSHRLQRSADRAG